MKRLIDPSVWKFLLVGVGNTLLSAVISLVLYNLWGVDPVLASAIAYLAGAVMSFFVNRRFTFHSDEVLWKSAVKFALNVAVLWTVTTPFIQPRVADLLAPWLGEQWSNSLAVLFSMGLYTVLNYFGQRYFAFRKGRV